MRRSTHNMPIRYACFISYPHGQTDLTKKFIGELKDALAEQIEGWQDEQVYLDAERLQPGYKFNESIARAICESVCMIVVYSPRYEKHLYCLREYAAMEQLEEQRRPLIKNPELREKGMIIPIVFRGKDYIPEKIGKRLHYLDFENYVTPRAIGEDEKYAQQIADLAKYIYSLFHALEESDSDVCTDCDQFRLPAEDQVKPWRQRPEPQLPR
ncbi:MAG TPA: toll/interleukin-1 receptor domain-containing protein [Thermoanaerobaculia bacterium]